MARHRPGPSGPAVRRPGCPSFPVLVHEADSHGTLTGRRRHPFESVLQLWAGHFPCLGAVLRAEPLWVETFTGLRLRQFEGLLRAVPERGGDGPRTARPWCLPLADRVLVVAVHYRTNLTMRHLAPLFGVSPATVCWVIQRLGPVLAIEPVRRPADATDRLWTRPHGMTSKAPNRSSTCLPAPYATRFQFY